MVTNRRTAAAIIAALAGVACLAAACSSSPASPAGKSSPGSVGARALAYSKCMRTHDVPNFPDPKINGNGVSVGVGAGVANSPAYKTASRACKSLAPPGLARPPQQTAAELVTDVKFADCMRSHGYPSFPDPDGRGVFNLPGTINSNSAQFNSASQTCRSQTKLHNLAMRQGGPGAPPSGS
jgi:hypothetical protein